MYGLGVAALYDADHHGEPSMLTDARTPFSADDVPFLSVMDINVWPFSYGEAIMLAEGHDGMDAVSGAFAGEIEGVLGTVTDSVLLVCT